MTKDEINIAIAKDQGWEYIRSDHEVACSQSNHPPSDLVGLAPVNVHLTHCDTNLWCLPDYHGDLNAIHEVEKTFYGKDHIFAADYSRVLCHDIRVKFPLHATAPQRCEAYLKAKGLWKTTSPACKTVKH